MKKLLLLLFVPLMLCSCNTASKRNKVEYAVITSVKESYYAVVDCVANSEWIKYDKTTKTDYYKVECLAYAYDYRSRYIKYDYIVTINKDGIKLFVLYKGN